jgi:hypothetical protein
MATRQSGILESELPELHQKAVDLLDMLQKHLSDKTGEKGKCNFEKAHSILHNVCEIVLWGNSDNTSCQAPEVRTWYILLHTWYILCLYLFSCGTYCLLSTYFLFILSTYFLSARPYREYQIIDTESYRDLQESYRAYNFVMELEIRAVQVLKSALFRSRPYNEGTYCCCACMARRPLTV